MCLIPRESWHDSFPTWGPKEGFKGKMLNKADSLQKNEDSLNSSLWYNFINASWSDCKTRPSLFGNIRHSSLVEQIGYMWDGQCWARLHFFHWQVLSNILMCSLMQFFNWRPCSAGRVLKKWGAVKILLKRQHPSFSVGICQALHLIHIGKEILIVWVISAFGYLTKCTVWSDAWLMCLCI